MDGRIGFPDVKPFPPLALLLVCLPSFLPFFVHGLMFTSLFLVLGLRLWLRTHRPTAFQRSKMHEVEMDENKVVVHTRRGSTAVGVTPSDPSAIVDLFQEVESIGEICSS